MTAKIRFDGVGKVFQARGKTVTALDDITLDIHSGQFVVLVGPSGAQIKRSRRASAILVL
jgi:NitT/TauT family transport system ATP-binding protein